MRRTIGVCAAFVLTVACAPGFGAAVEWAGSPIIHLDADDLTPGATGEEIVWVNKADPGGAFEADPAQVVQPTVKQSVPGQNNVKKNYVEFVRAGGGGYGDDASFLLWTESAPDTISQGDSFSVEAWVYLTTLDELQTFFSIGRRKGPDPAPLPTSPNNFACSASWANTGGNSNRAVGMATANLTWVNPPQLVPSYNHFAVTYDDFTSTVSMYVNGVLNNSLILASPLNIIADMPVYVGAMWFSGNAKFIQQGMKNAGLAELRVHDDLLTAEQVKNNFEAEKLDYISYRPVFREDPPVEATVAPGTPSTVARQALISPVFLTPPSTDVTWSLADPVPGGFSIDALTGTITIAITVAPGDYDLTVVATNAHGSDSLPVTLTVAAGLNGLRVTTYDTTQGAGFLNPISALMAVRPSGTTTQLDDITYPADFLFTTVFPGLTSDDSFSILWLGRFDATIEGSGEYTFGTESDDGSVLYLDLNDDGDFEDAGELVVNNNGDHGSQVITGTAVVDRDSVRIAIAVYENGGAAGMTARFKAGAGVAWASLEPIGGDSGHFTAGAPAAPTGLAATAGSATVGLNWSDNTESDFASYNVYRRTERGVYGAALAGGLKTSEYTDDSATNGVTYFYVVSAVNSDGYESALSSEVKATPKAKEVYVFMGDINGDSSVDIGDPIALLNYLFVDGPRPMCAKAADANDDDQLDIADPIALLNYQFGSSEMKAPDGSVLSAPSGNIAACSPYAADGTDGGGRPNFPAAVSELPACETPCQ